MWARGDMKIQIPHKLGLTLLKINEKQKPNQIAF